MKTLYAKLPQKLQTAIETFAQLVGGWALWLLVYCGAIALYASTNHPEKLTDMIVEMLVQDPIYSFLALILALRMMFYIAEELAASLLSPTTSTPMARFVAAIVPEDKPEEE